MKAIRFLCAIGLLALIVFASSHAMAATVVAYTTLPGATGSTVFTSLRASGTSIFVEHYKNVSYARFAFSGTINIVITAIQNVTSCVVDPTSYRITTTKSGSTCTLTLSTPRTLQVKINSLEKLFIFADALEVKPPVLGQAGVYDATTYAGVDSTGATNSTTGIQNAIDDVNAKGGGTLYFKNGKYLTGALNVKSNVTLYLKSGALIKGVTTRVYYPTDAAGEAYLIRFNGISNAGIKGRGVIDGGGQAYRTASCPRGWNIKYDCPGSPMLVKIVNSTRIRVADVYERDPASWTNHVHYSDGITLEGLKVLADTTANNNDGANVDASTNVTVRRVFVYVGDDAFCVKATNNLGLIKTSSNIVFQDNVVASAIKATKLGTETKVGGNMTNVWFNNTEVIHARNSFLAIFLKDGNTIDGIHWIGMNAKDIFPNGVPINIAITKRTPKSPIGTIRNLEIIDLKMTQANPPTSTINGFDSTHKVTGVKFMNLTEGGVVKTSLSSANITVNSYTSNITFTRSTTSAYEVENLAVYGSLGDGNTIVSETGASNEQWSQYAANAANDWLTLTIPNVTSGTYVVHVGVKKSSNRGIFQLATAVPGGTYTDLGPAQDIYGQTGEFVDMTVGAVTYGTTGNKEYRFTVTGKNVNSSGYDLGIDYIKMIKQQ